MVLNVQLQYLDHSLDIHAQSLLVMGVHTVTQHQIKQMGFLMMLLVVALAQPGIMPQNILLGHS